MGIEVFYITQIMAAILITSPAYGAQRVKAFGGPLGNYANASSYVETSNNHWLNDFNDSSYQGFRLFICT